MKLGHASKNNTPAYPVYLSGYPREEQARNVHLPVEIHALCIEIDQHRFCLCVVDTLLIDERMCAEIRQAVVKTHVLAYHEIHICATHTHSAPCIAKLNIPDPPMDATWRKKTIEHCVQAIFQSTRKMVTCECYFAKQTINGFYGNRNDINGIENKDVYVFTFRKDEKILGRFVSLSCHNTVNSIDNVISADLFGAIRTNLKDGFTVLVNGASGDISTRNYRIGCDCKEVDRVGRQIADILSHMKKGIKVEETGFHYDMVSTHVYQDCHDDATLNQKIKELEIKKKQTCMEGWDAFTLESYQMRKKQGSFYFDLESHIFMNQAYIFLTIPGELLTYFDRYLHERNPHHQVILITTCDGYAGYLVPDNQYSDFEEEMAMVKAQDVWRHIHRIQRVLEHNLPQDVEKSYRDSSCI